MAIDADLNAGLIDQQEAQRRRQDVSRQADFFGAMDGASKFVRGDAVAGILITLINILGGLVIGIVQAGMSFSQAADLFTKLTIGDGLVTQVPAFLISLSAGLLVTRSNSETNLPGEFLRQLFSRPQVLAVAGAFLGMLIFTSLPTVPLMLIGGSCVGLAMMLSRQEKRDVAAAATKAQEAARKKPDQRIEDYLSTDPLEIEIGVGLVRLADPKRGGNLLDRIQQVRQSVATEIGIVMPKVRIRDNLRLEPTQYRIKIADIPVAEAALEPAMLLAIDTGVTGKVRGIETREPAQDRPATWIEPSLRDQAEMFGYQVVEPAGVLAAHLAETMSKHADEILTRDATKHLIGELKKTSPAVVEELIPAQMKLAEVQRILQMLLREQVPVRQLGPILETLGDYASRIDDPMQLTEHVRRRLARVICTRYRDTDGKLHVITLDPALEDRIDAAIEHTSGALLIRLPPFEVEHLCDLLADGMEKLARENRAPVALVSPRIRAALKQLTAAQLPRLVVLSYNEITRDTQIESVAMISEPQPAMAA
jgi:flagellar biosynthesis protein FlhA